MKLGAYQLQCLKTLEAEDPGFLQPQRRILLAWREVPRRIRCFGVFMAEEVTLPEQVLEQLGWGLSSSAPPGCVGMTSIILGHRAGSWLSLRHTKEKPCVCAEHSDRTGGVQPKVLQGAEADQSCGRGAGLSMSIL